VLVHSSLRSLGWVQGGPRTVVTALRKAVGRAGTIVVPALTDENSATSPVHLAAIAGMTDDEVKLFMDGMPAFDPRTTPTAGAGVIAETVRTAPGAARSVHPQSSFAGIGARATELMADHALDCHYGERSPLRKLYDLDAGILLLGVGYGACTAFHLSEYRYRPHPPKRVYSCVVETDGISHWTDYEDVVLDDHEFETIGECMENAIPVHRGLVGAAECRMLSLRHAVDFATDWLAASRK
jgi:aminoglycoside 3-N-acetyltransferase